MTYQEKCIAIVGGGAAGMMVAATLIDDPLWRGKIYLFEKNASLGAKVIISGGGRCNLTTGYIKKQDLKKAYTRGWDFLSTAMGKFGPRLVRKWFEEQGIACKEESDKRIFPVSNDGKEVVRMFTHLFSRRNIDMHVKEPITDIQYKELSETYVLTSDQNTYEVDIVVLTTGGNAYAHTGSSGDGYAFASRCGHTITTLGPSLNSFMTSETRLHACSGLSFQEAVVEFLLGNRERATSPSPVLLTHFGISGPLAFIVASEIAFETVSKDSPMHIRLIPIASMKSDNRETLLLGSGKETPKKEITTILSQHLPKRFCEAILAKLSIDTHSQISVLRKDDRKQLADWLGNGIPLSLIKRRPGDEFVTAGGVDTSQVNSKTGESTICPGLYFAGEILNVDGITGGYNLQACWAMGRLVGKSIASSVV